ncbi:hypothetical protein [Propionivibrio sp.]|uniref:hypothetical protein n=1 Tax=Propionivibrio sp. TaxID=2212460 RepID=UPI003BF0E293
MAEDKPAYLKEMLTSQGNLYALLGSTAVGVVLSIPFGFGVGAIPLIAFAAGEIIAAMYLPSSISFRDRVDRKLRRQGRVAARNQLLQEIEARCTKRDNSFQQLTRVYTRMSERIAALYAHADSSSNRLSLQDVEKLEDAGLDYLRVWLAVLVMEDRATQINLSDIEERIAGLDRELKSPRPGSDLRQLQKARAEYVAIIERYHRMTSRKRALEAAMLSMPDQMEEIYQTIMTTSDTEDVGSRLDDAIAKLRLQEDIEAELAGEINGFDRIMPGIVAQASRPGAKKPQLTAINGSRNH